MIDEIYDDIRVNLETNFRGLTETEIFYMFNKFPKSYLGDNIRRNKDTFEKIILPGLKKIQSNIRYNKIKI